MQIGKCHPVWILLLLLAFPSRFLSAQTDSVSSEIAKNIFLKDCAQGLKVLVIEDTALPLVRIQLTARAGTDRQELPTEGLVQLQEALFFQARLRGDTSVADRMQEAGILMDVKNGIDYSGYQLSISDGSWQDALSRLVPCLRLPNYAREDLEIARTQIAKVFQEAETNPLYYLERDINQALWGIQFPRKNPLGRFEVIYQANVEQLTQFHDRFYYPENCLLGITGPIDHAEVFATVDTLFSFWEGLGANTAATAPFPKVEENPYFFVENELVKIPLIQAGWQGAGRDQDPKGALAGELIPLLLNRAGSRFQKKMVGTDLCLQAIWQYEPTAPMAAVELTVLPDPRKIDRCLDTLHAEIDRVGDPGYFSSTEVADAVQRLIYDWRYRRERSTGYLDWLSAQWAGGGLEAALDRPEALGEISLEDVERFTARYFKDQPFAMGMLVSSSDKAGLALESVFKNPRLVIDTVPDEPSGPPFDVTQWRINFLPNSMTPDFESRIMLSGVATKMKANPEVKLYVDGHTDSYGGESYNLKLSEERAGAIVEYLVKFHKLEADRLIPRGFGESQPEVKERTEADRSRNRRVVFTFAEGGGS